MFDQSGYGVIMYTPLITDTLVHGLLSAIDSSDPVSEDLVINCDITDEPRPPISRQGL